MKKEIKEKAIRRLKILEGQIRGLERMVEKEEEEKPLQLESMTPQDKKKLITELTKDMRRASRDLDFETAARLRDEIARVT